jgi:catechol 2,3-dioxygenase-like lactoylglutathione lyase family enzyme
VAGRLCKFAIDSGARQRSNAGVSFHPSLVSLTSIAHVCIFAANLDATLRFYCALGLRKQFDFTKQGRVIGYYLRVSENTFIEVFEKPGANGATSASNLSHICLETDAIEGLRQQMADAGYQPGDIKLGCDQSYQFWIKDPNGVDIEFHQYTPQSAQLGQTPVEVNW